MGDQKVYVVVMEQFYACNFGVVAVTFDRAIAERIAATDSDYSVWFEDDLLVTE